MKSATSADESLRSRAWLISYYPKTSALSVDKLVESRRPDKDAGFPFGYETFQARCSSDYQFGGFGGLPAHGSD
ncbi:MAG: hypothetical protein V4710_12550 [Verrucomicrobiota bacterium]